MLQSHVSGARDIVATEYYTKGTLLRLRPSDVHVWHRRTSVLPVDVVLAADQYLSDEERLRRDRLEFAADRRDFAAAHDLLRRALSCCADVDPAAWTFTSDDYRRPFVDGPEAYRGRISFSLSHTRGSVSCGVSLTSVGIDVECADRVGSVQEIADQHFSADEASWLRGHSEETRRIQFTELWTLKEAFLKAIGIGLSGSLADASFRLSDPGRIQFEAPPGIDRATWHFALFALGSNVRLAIAVSLPDQPRFTIHSEDPATVASPLAVTVSDVLEP